MPLSSSSSVQTIRSRRWGLSEIEITFFLFTIQRRLACIVFHTQYAWSISRRAHVYIPALDRPEKRPLICVVKSQLSAAVNTIQHTIFSTLVSFYLFKRARKSIFAGCYVVMRILQDFVCALQHWLANIVITMRACLSFECFILCAAGRRCESEKSNLLVEIAMKSLLIIYTWDARAGIVVDSDKKSLLQPFLLSSVSTHTWDFNSATRKEFDSCHMAFCCLI